MMEAIYNWPLIRFAEPMWLWMAAALILLLPLWKRLRPAMAHTNTGMHKITSFGWPSKICMLLLALTWLAFTGAMAKPKLTHQQMREFLDARDFVIGMDRSGSMFTADIESKELQAEINAFEQGERDEEKKMRDKFPTLYPYEAEPEDKNAKKDDGKVMRFPLARYAAIQFLKSRPEGDRAALFTFDDEAYWAWPLGKDVNIVLRKVSELSRQSGGGTNFDGPSGSNRQKGAFQATLEQFDSLGKSKTQVIIFISDGDAGINEERHQYFVEQMRKDGRNIHIFALVCGAQTQLTNTATQSLRRLVEEVNPKDWKDVKGEPVDAVIWAGNGEAMKKAFDKINELEKSSIELEAVESQKPIESAFTLFGCIAGGLFLGLCFLFRESF
ncbi:MAG: vWA domain-containing protein [Candidatus Melainabacteria bacterium]|nr:vWA domain-containing protein [Candidatus Melainabacteria bacterium]